MRYSPIFFYQQFLSLLLLSLSFQATLSATHLCSHDQSAALIQFKTHFSISKTVSKDCEYGKKSYPKTNSWKKGIDCCLWDGVSCDNITGQVISLDLSCSWLYGTFPSNNTIFLLSNLQRLDLSFNDFKKSTISSHFGRFSSLTHLDLSSSSFSGQIPYEISYLSKLVSLDLSVENVFNLPNIEYLVLDDNPSLSCQLPKLNWTSPLVVLSASDTPFYGGLPETIGNLKSLQTLGFVNSNFSGAIPTSLGNLSQLSSLNLPFNNFSGNVPYSLTNLTQLWFNTFLALYPSQFKFLSLENNKFNGTIPSSISKLVNLKLLDLSSNRLNGTVRMEIFSKLQQLTSLELSANNLSLISPNSSVNFVLPNLEYVFLSSCNISVFPNFVMGSKVLKQLDLSNNRIYGQIPKFPWKNIQLLDLHSNSFQGDLPTLPRSINFFSVSNNNLTGEISCVCNMKFVGILDLSHNNFSGIIPQCVGNFSQSLWVLNLKMNKFHGIIPSTFAKGCGLRNLNLNSNQLEGPLTPSISNCKDLEVLDLGNNMINDTFPHWIEALPELQVLVLHSNHFQGSVVASKNPQSLSKLQIIDLSNNFFSGPLPTSYMQNLRAMMNLDKGKVAAYINGGYDFSIALVVKGLEVELVKILTIFTSIDLSMNNFQGEIPEMIGELISLRGLNLSHNNLIGDIPPSLGNLSSLEWLDLSSNKLDGQIPRELLDLTFLSFFNVSYNHLVGPIPQGKQFNTYENGSYQGNEGLCGFPLSRGCSSSNKQPPPAEMNSRHKEDGSMFEFRWKIVTIGYGFGFVFGVSLGYVALRMGKPRWLMTLFKLNKY
ncbi:hypothetical protein COLO4_38378 [Corchorus olitorius]|uniref:Leucine-rich repeat-containing N-terminal plant-type domain-containing protein n=1 Tax=Corchorus olitorius TaxID=93759 RepID=A0A1R3FVK8_9ROSI|nr:hypothetical protein COLO4_38378 [Corchorus olitorius]